MQVIQHHRNRGMPSGGGGSPQERFICILSWISTEQKNTMLDCSQEGKSYRKTAAAITVVHNPFLSPCADWQTCFVLMILPLAL